MAEFFTAAHPAGYTLSTDPTQLNLAAIHRWLSEESYWARHIPRATVERAVANSLNFGLYAPDGRQAGFARVISDYTTFAWLCDIFVLEEHRSQGLSKWLMEQILAHPDLQHLRRYMLGTWDAHGLYQQFGYAPVARPERLMEILHANHYASFKEE